MHVDGVIAFPQEMVIVRIDLHLKLLVRLYQRIDILHGVLEMDIVIRRAVNDQHVAV